MARVQIGTCSGPADAALVKSAFAAHRIPVLINAEQHAGMLAGLGGAMVPLHILVDSEHADEASALLADLREQDRKSDAERDADAEDDRELAAISADRSERRRRQGTVLVIILAGVVALPYVLGNPLLTVAVVLACAAAIFVTLRPDRPANLPRAKLQRSPKK
jgi:hypothetical protein